jgi:hypothetical protein
MDYGNSIFSWFNIRKLKTCIFPVICVIIVLDANFKNLPGKPSIQNRTGDNPSIVTYILDFIFMEERSI